MITSDELAADVVRFVFQTQLGREPTQSDIAFQKTFLTEGRLSVGDFNYAIHWLEEARRFSRTDDGAVPEEVYDLYGCSFAIPSNSFLASVLQHRMGYEWWALPLFLDLCRPGATVVDMGANWGAYAIPAARRVGPTGRVFAVEANSHNAKVMLRNAKRNGVTLQYLTVALSDQVGVAMLEDEAPTNSGFVILDKADVDADPRDVQPVTMLPLDLLRQTIGRVDLMKLDIEGAEYRACLGAKRIITEDRPAVFLEYCPILLKRISKSEPGELLGMFLDLDYSIDVMHIELPIERILGSRSEIIERVIAYCDAVPPHIDIRLLPN